MENISINHTDKEPRLISYLTLRKSVGILGISLPVVLIIGSVTCGDCREIQSSISSYYHTGMRDILVGILCAVALFLFAYRGYDRRDSLAGNLACIFALGVAFFPTSVSEPLTHCIPEAVDTGIVSTIHFMSAAGFFLVLSYFSLFLFTISKEPVTPQKKIRNRIYRVCAYAMLGSMALIALYSFYLENKFPVLRDCDPVFWLETLALWAFGISWLTKGETLWADPETSRVQ